MACHLPWSSFLWYSGTGAKIAIPSHLAPKSEGGNQGRGSYLSYISLAQDILLREEKRMVILGIDMFVWLDWAKQHKIIRFFVYFKLKHCSYLNPA